MRKQCCVREVARLDVLQRAPLTLRREVSMLIISTSVFTSPARGGQHSLVAWRVQEAADLRVRVELGAKRVGRGTRNSLCG